MTKIMRTTVTVTILHPVDETPDGLSLEEIGRQMDDGGWIGQSAVTTSDAVPDDAIRAELQALGNDGAFFDDWL